MFQFFSALLVWLIIFYLLKVILIDTVKDEISSDGKISGYLLAVFFEYYSIYNYINIKNNYA